MNQNPKYRSKKRRAKKSAVPSKLVTGEIGELGLHGDGALHVEKKIYHVPFTVPGDQGVFAVSGQRGVIESLETQGAMRRPPLCQHHGSCGGCQMQHLDPDYYQAWKSGLVRRFLQREGFGDVPIFPLLSSGLKTRRRAGISLQKSGGTIISGFQQRRTNLVIPIQDCDILHPDIFNSFGNLATLGAPFFIGKTNSISAFVTLTDTGLDVDFSGVGEEASLTLAQRETISDIVQELGFARLTMNGAPFLAPRTPIVKISGVPVALPPKGFLQATKDGEVTLIKLVRDYVGEASMIADLYSGCGTFALSLGKSMIEGGVKKSSVFAADATAPAIDALSQAAHQAGLPVTAVVRDLDHQPLMPSELNKFDAVVFDPPRAGAEAQASELAKSDVPRVVAVSCNPQTFTRDAGVLRAGGYQLLSVQPVDQFVFTPHIELVGHFERA